MRAVGLDEPFFVRRGEGAYIEDVDGRRYVDWVHVLGAADLRPRRSRDASRRSRGRRATGRRFGAPTEREVELAAEIVDAVPSVEQVRLVSSGTEAAMSAIRLARAATRRDRIAQVRGLLPRARRRAARGRGLRRWRRSGSRRRPGVPDRRRRRHDRLPVQRRRRGRGRGRAATARGSPRSSSSRSPGTWASSRPQPGFLEALRRALRRVGRAARLRRGDHRLPRRARRRAGALRRRARPDHPRQDRRRRPAARGVRRPRRA